MLGSGRDPPVLGSEEDDVGSGHWSQVKKDTTLA
jgi:hypothetical protein